MALFRCAALLLLSLVPAASASAASSSMSYTSVGEHAFVVPAAVTSLQVTAVGANGGAGTGADGGLGATISATVAVTPGQTLFAEVGGVGGRAVAGGPDVFGGAGGGGNGGATVFLIAGAPSGGGGGGASDLRTCSAAAPAACPGGSSLASRLLVAGGGGGGGGNGNDAAAKGFIFGGVGGAGGGPGGSGGADPHGDLGGQPGHQGNQASGGAAGGNSPGSAATAGELARGGVGGTAPTSGGGGGGSGLYGGGGGAAGGVTVIDPNKLLIVGAGGGGGGGGASGAPAGAPGVSAVGAQDTDPASGAAVRLTWTSPAPTVAAGGASAVAASTAAIHGTVNPNNSPVTDCHVSLAPAPAGGADVPCGQQLGSGSAAVAVTAALTGLAPSTSYRATLTATSTAGTSTATPVQFTTAAGGPALAVGTAAPGDTAGPNRTGAGAFPISITLSPPRFAVTARRHRRVGTTLAVSVAHPATVTISFARAHGHRWTRVRGRVVLRAKAGRTTLRFRGVLGGHRLTPGRYRITATATGQATVAHTAARVVR